MCGRYVSRTDAEMELEWNLSGTMPLFSSYNVTPTTQVPIVRLDGTGGREGVLLRWGLIPFWANGVPPKYSTINATCERMQTAPSYRGPWKRGQRCLFPVNGFYEWQAVAGQKTKQPWYVRLVDHERFAFGGLWDRSRGEDGTVVESCTIVTMPANPLMAGIHNTKKRMPLILPSEGYAVWLAEDNVAAAACIEPYPDARMEAWPVSTYVNRPANDDPRCCAPN